MTINGKGRPRRVVTVRSRVRGREPESGATPLARAIAEPICCGAGEQRLPIGSLPQQRRDAAQNAAVETIGKDRLQAVAYFDAIVMILDREQQHDPLVLALLADAPLAEERVGDVFDRFAVERIDGDNRHLDAGGLFHAATIGFQLGPRLRIEHVREVADVALRLERFEIEGRREAAIAHKVSAARASLPKDEVSSRDPRA